MFSCRSWNHGDEAFLWEMLYQSIHVGSDEPPPPRSILDQPDIAHYLSDFGHRRGDDAQIAIDDVGTRIGAAFCRRMAIDDPGYGFISGDIPELGMAVVPDWRGRRVGRRLLEDLLARNPSMSLSVDRDNHAAEALYVGLGFVEVAVEGTAKTMLRR